MTSHHEIIRCQTTWHTVPAHLGVCSYTATRTFSKCELRHEACTVHTLCLGSKIIAHAYFTGLS